MKPIYFDFTVPDVSQAKAFFERVLGWHFERFDMPYEYYRIQAGSEAEPGIDGGIGAVKDAPLSGHSIDPGNRPSTRSRCGARPRCGGRGNGR
jgi:predicted enzyme related to lactoylglutathione lyase